MKTLLLMRHAKSSWKNEGQDDIDRPLNDRGVRDAEEIGRRLVTKAVIPSIIVASTALRTKETTRLVVKGLTHSEQNMPEMHYEKSLYAAAAQRIALEVWQLPDIFDTALIVAHNPGITEAVGSLSGYWLPGGMKTSTVACIRFDVEHWHDAGHGELLWTMGPERTP